MSKILLIQNQLIKNAEQSYKIENKFSDEILQTLHAFYGEVFVRALDLMDSGKFTIYQSVNGLRQVLKVRGKSEEYTVFPDINYCPCPAFKYHVLNTRKSITCKHILAGKLMQITEKIPVETYNSDLISELIRDQIPNEL